MPTGDADEVEQGTRNALERENQGTTPKCAFLPYELVGTPSTQAKSALEMKMMTRWKTVGRIATFRGPPGARCRADN